MSLFLQLIDVLRLLPGGGPGACNIAVTNACNAKCDFCGYAYDKMDTAQRLWVDFDGLCRALDILHGRGIRYLTFTGGEPLLHPRLTDMIAFAVRKNMRPALVTNGSRLSNAMMEKLHAAGLQTLYISVDASRPEAHEENRGLPHVCERIRSANETANRLGMKTIASVTINRLMDDIEQLFCFLEKLGFTAVTFTYPKRALFSSSRVFSNTSSLIDYTASELIEKIEAIKAKKSVFPIQNPAEALSEVIRFHKGEQQVYPCVAGHKYFYLDYRLDIYRCDFLPERLGSIFEFGKHPPIREHCTKCTSVCYRDASVMMHPAVSIGDALGHLKKGKVLSAFRTVLRRTNWFSLQGLAKDWRLIAGLARTGSARNLKAKSEGPGSESQRVLEGDDSVLPRLR